MTKVIPMRTASPAEKFSVLIVQSPYYKHITSQLLEGAKARLEAAGCEIEVTSVPGALEIPGTVSIAYEFGDYDGFVALGCVIRGETTHYEIVSSESARGLMDLAIDGACIGNGILTVENEGQAMTRANVSEMNKGAGAAEACLAMMQFRFDQESRDD